MAALALDTTVFWEKRRRSKVKLDRLFELTASESSLLTISFNRNQTPNGFPKGKEVPNEPEFLSVMMPLYRFMTIFGRFPFKLKEREDKKKRFFLVKTSPQYFWFFLTTILFGLGAAYTTNNMSKIYAQRPPFTIYK